MKCGNCTFWVDGNLDKPYASDTDNKFCKILGGKRNRDAVCTDPDVAIDSLSEKIEDLHSLKQANQYIKTYKDTEQLFEKFNFAQSLRLVSENISAQVNCLIDAIRRDLIRPTDTLSYEELRKLLEPLSRDTTFGTGCERFVSEAAKVALADNDDFSARYFARHYACDWGEIALDNKAAAVKVASRQTVKSKFLLKDGSAIYVVTSASKLPGKTASTYTDTVIVTEMEYENAWK